MQVYYITVDSLCILEYIQRQNVPLIKYFRLVLDCRLFSMPYQESELDIHGCFSQTTSCDPKNKDLARRSDCSASNCFTMWTRTMLFYWVCYSILENGSK